MWLTVERITYNINNMDEYSLIEKIGQIAGIGGVALGVFLLIFKEIIRKNIFPNLTRQQAYNIIKLIIVLTFLVAIFGIAAWLWSETNKNGKFVENTTIQKQGKFRRIYYQGFDRTPDANELNQMWLKEKSGDWQGRFTEGVHSLCNISNSDSASFTSTFRYIQQDGREADMSNAKVTLRVKLVPPNGKYSSVGILFRKDINKANYYAFVLNSGSSVSLIQRSGSKYKNYMVKRN